MTAPDPAVQAESTGGLSEALGRGGLWDDEPLTADEVEAQRLGRCGPLRYGGPCWLAPGHTGPHHAYRDGVEPLLAARDAVQAREVAEALRQAADEAHTEARWVAEQTMRGMRPDALEAVTRVEHILRERAAARLARAGGEGE